MTEKRWFRNGLYFNLIFDECDGRMLAQRGCISDEYDGETLAHNVSANIEKRLFTCMHSNLSKQILLKFLILITKFHSKF